MSLLFFLIPNPFRKPLCRNAPTDEPACSSIIPIVTFLPFVAARAYLPIRMPALKLFVAKRALVALFGTVGVSRAITMTPALRAFAIAAFSAFPSATVIRIPFTPAVVMFSIAAIWLALSELLLPAAYVRLAPSLLAAFVAPARILTKNGFVASFVIRPTLTFALFDEVVADAAATIADVATTTTRSAAARPSVRQDGRVSCLCGSRICYLLARGRGTDNTFA